MPRPLEGIRVLELGFFWAGPGAAAILGDLGAEVIKIEQPGIGDPNRVLFLVGRMPYRLPGNQSTAFASANRNKRSVTLDMSKEKGREMAHRLVEKSDVFLTSIRSEAADRLGMGYDVLSRLNPRLIYARVSGYGPKGPESTRGGFDLQAQAKSGMMLAMGEPGTPPQFVQYAFLDQSAAIMASHAVLTALLMRERVGIGQEVEVSLLGTALFMQYLNVAAALLQGGDVIRHDRTSTDPLRNYYRCQDGQWLVVACIPSERFWESFCQVIGRPELGQDPRLDTPEKRLEHATEIIEIMDRVFASKPREHWLELLAQKDLLAAEVNSHLDLAHDPQILANDYIVDFDHPSLGKVKIPGYPIHFSATQAKTTRAAPKLGEHTREVLGEVVGCSEKELAELRREGVI